MATKQQVTKQTTTKPETAKEDIKSAIAAQGPFITPKPEQLAVSAPKAEAKKPADTAPAAPTKADLAREIFKRMEGKARKEVLAAFISEAGLTPAGAATYFANCRRQQSK